MMAILSSVKNARRRWRMKRREKRSTWKKDMDVRLKEKMNFFKLEKSKECVFPLGNNHFFSPRALHINMLKKKKKKRFVL